MTQESESIEAEESPSEAGTKALREQERITKLFESLKNDPRFVVIDHEEGRGYQIMGLPNYSKKPADRS